MSDVPTIYLARHGETEWSKSGQHTGRTDIPLTPHGEDAARALRPDLRRRHIVAVFTSPARRAQRTAELAGLEDPKQDPDLWEWDYGGYEGLTTATIRKEVPGWTVWANPVPGGETPQQVSDRLDRVVRRVEEVAGLPTFLLGCALLACLVRASGRSSSA